MLDAVTDFVPPLFTASSDDDAAANDNEGMFAAAILRAERRLRILERLTEIGMEMTEVMQRRLLAEDEAATVSTVTNGEIDVSAKSAPSKIPRFDPTEAFAKLSRTVRLTIHLETKADDALRALQSGRFLARETRKAERKHRENIDVRARCDAARAIVDKRVSAVIDRESLNEADYCDLMEAMLERFGEDEAYLDIADRPLRETVGRLCGDLGLSPDWSRWVGDDWTPDEGPPMRSHWSVFNTPSRKPLNPNGDSDDPDSPNPQE
jgi:hypothetical protein